MIVRGPSPKVADPTLKDFLFINGAASLDSNHNMKKERRETLGARRIEKV